MTKTIYVLGYNSKSYKDTERVKADLESVNRHTPHMIKITSK